MNLINTKLRSVYTLKEQAGRLLGILCLSVLSQGCQNQTSRQTDTLPVRLMTLEPGHFHAALVQKSMYAGVSPVVHVYASEGPEVKAHLRLIEKYNNRPENPTAWEQKVYTGPDYLEKMLQEKPGNVVVIAGNNQKKTRHIKSTVEAGLHVLADKPMAITTEDFKLLQDAFAAAAQHNVLLYDIMTERHEITNIIQKELAHTPAVFGALEKGTPQNPAIIKESVHHFYKEVSGAPLVRPAWYFDVEQEGDGIVDVTTHLVDLVQWSCFPEETLDYKNDIQMLAARRWPTNLTPAQFRQVTQQDSYPDYLEKDLQDSVLQVYANGEMRYTLKGVHARLSVIWNFQAPPGTGDTHFSVMRGTKANLVIRQGKEQGFKPALYLEPVTPSAAYEKTLLEKIRDLQEKYPGLSINKVEKGWEVIIPEALKKGHEHHFSQVTEKYLKYLKEGRLPAWEVPNMLAKYYTTTQALEKALEK